MAEKNAIAGVGTVGERLRQVRLRRKLHLRQLPVLTGGEFTAATVANYERGVRMPSVERLAALCGYYQVPLVEIVTGEPGRMPPPAPGRGPSDEIDLEWLAARGGPEAGALRRFAASAAARRDCRDSTGRPLRVLRIRTGDYEVLALALGTNAAGLRRRTSLAAAVTGR